MSEDQAISFIQKIDIKEPGLYVFKLKKRVSSSVLNKIGEELDILSKRNLTIEVIDENIRVGAGKIIVESDTVALMVKQLQQIVKNYKRKK